MLGVVFKKCIINGKLISPVNASAIGWEICMPSIPQIDVVTISIGINVNPLRNSDNSDAVHALRMLWYSILTGVNNGTNINPNVAYLSAGAPISITVCDFCNSQITLSANINTGVHMHSTVKKPITTVTINARFTRAYFLPRS